MRTKRNFRNRLTNFGQRYASEVRRAKPEYAAVLLLLALPMSLYAQRCPITPNGTVVVRAPVGNLIVETTGVNAVEVAVNNPAIRVQETCNRDTVEITATQPARMNGTAEWTLRVPRTVDLDLVTQAGSIQVGDSDGNVALRTTGGAVAVGNIRGRAAIITQGGAIRAGNIGGAAELRSEGGSLEVGNVAGDAEFITASGSISGGFIEGRVRAETGGGNITIAEARGPVVARTAAGDIAIGNAAARIDVQTAGGNITSRSVRGPFQGRTEAGDIHIDRAASWIEASTGNGDIFFRMIPENLSGDLHVDLMTARGNITISLPSGMKANIEAVVESPRLEATSIFSAFSINALVQTRTAGAPERYERLLNGGGNRVNLRTLLGKIDILEN